MEQVSSVLDRSQLARFAESPTVQPGHQRDAASPSGTTALHRAVLYDSINNVRGLLGAGADTMQPDDKGSTPLMIARIHGNKEIVHYMASEHDELVRVLGKCLGREPTQMEIYGVVSLDEMSSFRQQVRDFIEVVGPQLLRASREGELAEVKRLLDSGEIGIDVIDKKTNETAFSAALASDQRAVYLHLMERGAKMHGVCHIGGKGHSVLAAAVLSGDVNFVRQVVACGAPVVPVHDKPIETCALVEAARLGSIEMVETLMGVGVRVTYLNNLFEVPRFMQTILIGIRYDAEPVPWLLLCAACCFQDQKLFNYLIRKCPRLQDMRDKPRVSTIVLAYAVFRENEAMVTELLQRGAFVAPDPYHCVFFAAVFVKSTRMLEILLQHNSDVSGTGHVVGHVDRVCPLSMAAYLDAMDCVKLLLPLETRPDQRNAALLHAIEKGYVEIAAFLLDVSLPLSEQNLRRAIQVAKSPVVLDLLLSRCCGDEFPVSKLTDSFVIRCRQKEKAELLAVYLAHGLEIRPDDEDSPIQTSRVMDGAFRGWAGMPSATTLRFVLENGVPVVNTTSGPTVEQDLVMRKSEEADPLKKKELDDCLEIFKAFSY